MVVLLRNNKYAIEIGKGGRCILLHDEKGKKEKQTGIERFKTFL